MKEIIALALAFAGLTAGSLTDIRTREVPDWINYGLMLAGIGLAILATVIYEDVMFLFKSLLGLGFFFALGSILFYTGQWGGGDTKMLMGIGAIIGLTIPWPIPDTLQEVPFMLIFLGATLICGAVYGILWTIFLAIKKRKDFLKEAKKKLTTNSAKKIKYACIAVMILLSIGFLLTEDFYAKMSLLFLAIAIPLMFYLSLFVKITEKVCMIKKVSPDKLTEGEWIEEEIMENKKLIFKKGKILNKKDIEKIKEISEKYHVLVKRKYIIFWFTKKLHLSELMQGDFLLEKNPFIKTKNKILGKKEANELQTLGNYKFSSSKVQGNSLIKSTKEFDEYDLKPGDKLLEDLYFGEYISGPKDLGISKEKIQKLIEYMKQGNIKEVTIKEGVPFVPSFLLAFIVTLVIVHI
ncbi:MAG: A24 family peptidase [Candidatus Nanoarchaeia archaeon]